jgi:dihydrofolate reductase
MTDFDQPILDNLARVIDSQDTILLGRATYDYWVGFWPGGGPEPFHSFINQTEKHIFTSRPLDQEWANMVVVGGSGAEHVRKLKELDGGDIGIHGSIRLARSLIGAGLVDEYRLVVSSTVAGRGEHLFGDGDPLRRLDLVDVARTPGGTLLLGYRATTAGS